MAIKLFLKIFFSLPVWLLRCLTFQKSTIINNQILDFQTQVFLKLQSLQANTFDNPNTFNSAQELREELESGRDGLPLNAKPRRFVQTIDHFIPTEFGELKIREYCPERVLMESPILYFHGGGYVLGLSLIHI